MFTTAQELGDALRDHVAATGHEIVTGGESPLVVSFVCLGCDDGDYEIRRISRHNRVHSLGRQEDGAVATAETRHRILAEYTFGTYEQRQRLADTINTSGRLAYDFRESRRRNEIERLQERLGVTVDGIYGPETETAHVGMLPAGGVAVTLGEPEFVGRMPVRTELTVLPADDTRRMTLGWTVHESVGTVLVNPRGIRNLTATLPEAPAPAARFSPVYPTRFERAEPL